MHKDGKSLTLSGGDFDYRRLCDLLFPLSDWSRPLLANPGPEDGGDPQWSGPEPAFSERRLAQLLATRGPQRIIAVQRAARMLAPRLTAGSGIDTADIALAVLDPDNARRLAEPYYRRLDRAAQSDRPPWAKSGTLIAPLSLVFIIWYLSILYRTPLK